MLALIDVVLLAFLAVTAVAIVRLRDLFAAVMVTGIFSLLSAGLFTVMDAVDVAFTEASVGAGISTILMLATLAVTQDVEKKRWRRRFSPLALGVVVVTGAALVYGTSDMPRYGDPDAPIHHYLTPHFLEHTPDEINEHIPNVVTAVLASYRGYDTFGETTVIFTAAVMVLMLLGGAATIDRRRPGGGRMGANVVLRASAKPLVPLILLFALYVQFHGDFGPGGGFQAGVIFAAGLVLYALVYGPDRAQAIFTGRRLEALVALGVLIYGGAGVAGIVLGGEFLDYDLLAADPQDGQHRGIFLVELGVGITVAAVMTTLFLLFTGRGQPAPWEDRVGESEGTP